MFRSLDIVKVPDGRTGAVRSTEGDIIIVQFGADGPFEEFDRIQLKFVAGNEDLEAIGNKSFFGRRF